MGFYDVFDQILVLDGTTGSPGDREGPGATRRDAGTRVFLCLAAGGLAVGRGDLAAWAAPVGGGGVSVSAGSAATSASSRGKAGPYLQQTRVDPCQVRSTQPPALQP